MKIILSSVLSATILLATEQCEPMLEESMATTSACLAQLEINRKLIDKAKWYSPEKIAAVEDANEQYRFENRDLKIKVSELSHKNTKLTAENKKLKKEVSIATNETKSLSQRLKEQQRLLLSFTKNQKNYIDIEKEDGEKYKKRTYLSERSKILKLSYAGLSKKELFHKNIYKIPVYMSNVRKKDTRKSRISAIVRHNELVEFSEISVKHSNKDGKLVWIKTKKGWIYIASNRDKKKFIVLHDGHKNKELKNSFAKNVLDSKKLTLSRR